MKKLHKELTEQEKYDQQVQLEVDLARLMREYSIMERNRRAYARGATGKLAKQKRVINILKVELQNLQTDLNVATAPAKVKIDSEISDNLHELLKEHDYFNEKINMKKSHLYEVKGQIERVQKDVCHLEANLISDIQFQERVLNANKTLEALENKLDVQIKKFCYTLGQNKTLRLEIDHLLKERSHFNNMWEKLLKQLSFGKKIMLDLIEQATIAYDQREEWCNKLAALRTRAQSDLIAQTEEMRNLNRKIDHDKKLHDFMSVKCQKRIMVDLERQEQAKRLKQREEIQEKLELYEDILGKIFEFTGHSSLDAISSDFKKKEAENFSLFKYINSLNKDMEEIGDELGHLHMSIDEQRSLNESRAVQQEENIGKLQEQLDQATNEANDTQNIYDDTRKKLNQLLSGIDKMFKLCKCSNAPLLELLGNNTSINKYNVLLHLEILEKNINDMIIGTYYKEKLAAEQKKRAKVATQGTILENRKPGDILPIEQLVLTQPCPLCMQHELVSDVIDTLQFALTKEELQTRLSARSKLAGSADRLHNVSACFLPESRQIIQRRYQ